jgi:hypothetical protein
LLAIIVTVPSGHRNAVGGTSGTSNSLPEPLAHCIESAETTSSSGPAARNAGYSVELAAPPSIATQATIAKKTRKILLAVIMIDFQAAIDLCSCRVKVIT